MANSTKVTRVYRNSSTISNNRPSDPRGLREIAQADSVILMWESAKDQETPSRGLTYNLRVGTSSNGIEVVSPMAIVSTGQRLVPRFGNVYGDTLWYIKNLPNRTYYWSVQAVDNSFAGSDFATERSFIINAPPNNAPEITSLPITSTSPGSSYQYQVNADDPDGNRLTFTMNTNAHFLNIVHYSGLISGIPDMGDIGSYSVHVNVDDNKGGVATQDYVLLVTDYALPNPVVSLTVGNKYFYEGNYWHHGGYSRSWDFSEEIVGDTVINGDNYAIIRRSKSFADLLGAIRAEFDSTTYFLRRADSTTFYQYDPISESEDKLVDFEDTVGTEYPQFGTIWYKSLDTLFNETQVVVKLNKSLYFRYYASKLGHLGYGINTGGEAGHTELYAAVIDNTVYGDSTVIDIHDDKSPFPLLTYKLYPNYPNPFNPITTLKYDLLERSNVSLTIYNILGRQVRTLVRGLEEPGYKTVIWDGTNDLGESVSAGVYLYRIQAGDFTQTRKMLLLR